MSMRRELVPAIQGAISDLFFISYALPSARPLSGCCAHRLDRHGCRQPSFSANCQSCPSALIRKCLWSFYERFTRTLWAPLSNVDGYVRSGMGANEMAKSNIAGIIRNVYSTVSAKLQCPLANEGEILETGDFRLDLTRRKASLKGIDLALTSLEFDLLIFLVSHPNRVVTSHTSLGSGRPMILRTALIFRRRSFRFVASSRQLITSNGISKPNRGFSVGSIRRRSHDHRPAHLHRQHSTEILDSVRAPDLRSVHMAERQCSVLVVDDEFPISTGTLHLA